MKLMIASDIHGSAHFCKQLLNAFEMEKADKILLLGDILYHGPRNDLPHEYDPKKVITLLNNMHNKIYCVRGNCDTEVDQMVLSFPILADYCIIPIGKNMIFATHGHKFNRTNLPSMEEGDFFLYGHTHIPECKKENGITYLNPGSVSIPKEHSEHSYMVFEDNAFVWKNLQGTKYNQYLL